MKLSHQNAEQAGILHGGDLYPLGSDGLVDCIARCGVGMRSQFLADRVRNPNDRKLRLKQLELAYGRKIRNGRSITDR